MRRSFNLVVVQNCVLRDRPHYFQPLRVCINLIDLAKGFIRRKAPWLLAESPATSFRVSFPS